MTALRATKGESCWALFDDGEGKQSDFVDLLSDERKYAIFFSPDVNRSGAGSESNSFESVNETSTGQNWYEPKSQWNYQ